MRTRRVVTDRRAGRVRGIQIGVEFDGVVRIAKQRSQAVVVGVTRVRILKGVRDRTGEQRVRADLDEGAVPGARLGYGRTEANRVAQVGHPVVGVELRGRTRILDRGDDRDDGEARGQIGQRGLEFRQERIHHRVVGCHVDIDSAGEDVLLVGTGDHKVDGLGGPGNDRLTGRRVNSDRHVGDITDQLLGRGGVEFQQGDRTRPAQPGHQFRAAGDHPEALRRGQRTGNDRGRDLTHRVADHRVGFNPVVAPQRGQRELETHQHRLDTLDTGQLLAGREHVVQRETDFRNEVRLQFGDRRGEGGFVLE